MGKLLEEGAGVVGDCEAEKEEEKVGRGGEATMEPGDVSGCEPN